ncbi:MAG TPA: ribose-5-phosphate isomerase RpiA [Anaerolineales bacterium]|nr:ribose-5-phosphate isomerase RpiA [Anaerolineales bacterium]
MTDTINPKRTAAQAAMSYVRSGMVLGLGTGSTTQYFVDLLGTALQNGQFTDICGVPTSQATAHQASMLGIPLVSLSTHPSLDLAVDGADEVDPNCNLIKGLGKALLREKMVELHAKQFVVIVDASKLVVQLGEKCPLPVEIVPFEYAATLRFLQQHCERVEFWTQADGTPAVTDNGNYLAKMYWQGGIDNPHKLARTLTAFPGVVEHGLFLQMADVVLVATSQGVQTIQANRSPA